MIKTKSYSANRKKNNAMCKYTVTHTDRLSYLSNEEKERERKTFERKTIFKTQKNLKVLEWKTLSFFIEIINFVKLDF
jgi:hypothetical protein